MLSSQTLYTLQSVRSSSLHIYFLFLEMKTKNTLAKGYQRIVGWNNLLLHCKCLQRFTGVFLQHLQGKPYNNYKISLQSVNILCLVVFNPYLRTDSARLLIPFEFFTNL